jgi:C4-dicarboxylate-binding protein DctP
VGLAFWDNGFKQMSANRPLQMPSDFAGLSLRIQPSKILEAQMKALGAKARPMQFSEVYDALRTGAIDGTEGPVSNFYTQNLHLTQKYLTISNHGYLGYAVVVNKRFWDSLAPEIRNTLDDAMRDATAYANETAQRNNDAALAAVKRAGTTKVIQLGADDKLAWQKALIERIYQETGYRQAAISMR